MTLAAAWCAIGLGAGALAYRWRRRTLRLCVLVALTGAALIVALLLTGDVAAALIVDAARILIGTVLLSIVALLLAVRALPRLRSRRDRLSVAVICGAVAAGFGALAVFLAVAADDRTRVGTLPQLRTREAFLALRDAPPRPGGVLIEATISDRNPESEDGAVASISCRRIGPLRLPGGADRLPERYLLEFPGGPPIIAAGITSSRQAWNWPPGQASGTCELRRAAPVVVWGDIRKGMGGQGATSQTGLSNVRMIAAGDITSFLRDYVPVVDRTGRAVNALAVLNIGLALAVITVGFTTWRRLTRSGTDDPPMITWRSSAPGD